MMEGDYSNRALAYILLVALLISVAGTLITLNKMSSYGVPLISGSATSGQGTAQVTMGSTLSISIITSAIDFGTCRPNVSGQQYTILSSNEINNSGANEGQCTGLATPQNMTIQNEGNSYANVSVNINQANLTGGTINRSIFFTWVNDTALSYAGCYRGANSSFWVNFTSAGTDYTTCTNFTGPTKRIALFLRVWLPYDATTGTRSATLTFTARTPG